MKQLLLITVCLLCGTTSFYGQDCRIGKGLDTQTTALFINSVYVGNFHGFNIDSNKIDSIRIVQEPITIDGKSFKHQFHVLSSQQFNFVTLQELLEKYRDKNKPVYEPVFMINETVITKDVLPFKIDENYLLKLKCINSDELGYWKGKESFTIVSILTKTPENVGQQEKRTSPKYLFARDSTEWEKQKKIWKNGLQKKSNRQYRFHLSSICCR